MLLKCSDSLLITFEEVTEVPRSKKVIHIDSDVPKSPREEDKTDKYDETTGQAKFAPDVDNSKAIADIGKEFATVAAGQND